MEIEIITTTFNIKYIKPNFILVSNWEYNYKTKNKKEIFVSNHLSNQRPIKNKNTPTLNIGIWKEKQNK